MAREVRAVYEDGWLRVLDPVTLAEGEQVQVMILREQERTRAALGDLLLKPAPGTGDTVAEAGLLAEIDATVQGQVRVSEAIIQGNRSGRARVYAASGSGAMSIVGGAWGSNDGGAAPVTTAAQASVR